MPSTEHAVEVATGRRTTDGHLRVAVFNSELLALSVEKFLDRAPTLLLTREQALKLQSGLDALIPLLKESTHEDTEAKAWPGTERRAAL